MDSVPGGYVEPVRASTRRGARVGAGFEGEDGVLGVVRRERGRDRWGDRDDRDEGYSACASLGVSQGANQGASQDASRACGKDRHGEVSSTGSTTGACDC
jgi:hypothetical protein